MEKRRSQSRSSSREAVAKTGGRGQRVRARPGRSGRAGRFRCCAGRARCGGRRGPVDGCRVPPRSARRYRGRRSGPRWRARFPNRSRRSGLPAAGTRRSTGAALRTERAGRLRRLEGRSSTVMRADQSRGQVPARVGRAGLAEDEQVHLVARGQVVEQGRAAQRAAAHRREGRLGREKHGGGLRHPPPARIGGRSSPCAGRTSTLPEIHGSFDRSACAGMVRDGDVLRHRYWAKRFLASW